MKLNNKGFSLVEVLVAVVVSTIVFGAITALIVFASNSSKKTNARITLQNEAKDAVNHMESYIIESKAVVWDSTEHALVLTKDSNISKEFKTGNKLLANVWPYVWASAVQKKNFVYWYNSTQKKLFFGECYTYVSPDKTNLVDLKSTLPTTDMYLLADNVEDFSCKINKNDQSDKYMISFNIKFKDNESEYLVDKCVYLRNQ